jgi:hypothetical protein
MAILVASIYTRVIGITRRDEITAEDFNILLLEACNEIALRTGYLRSSQSGTLDADKTDDAPTDMLSDSSVETFKLIGSSIDDTLDPISFEEWKQNIRRGYCVYNGKIYVKPTRGNTSDYTIFYNRTHGAITVDGTLEFPDIYQPAIVQLSTSKVYGDKEIEDKEEYRRRKYEDEIDKLPSVNVGISHGRGSGYYNV